MGDRGVGGKSLATGGLAVGDEILVDVERAAGDGVCVARHEGQVVFVRDVLPGEQAKVRVTNIGRKGRFVRAELTTLLRASDRRVVPPCNLARECGGCDWQHADLDYQRELKRDILLENLRKFGGISDGVRGAAVGDIQSVDSAVPNDLRVRSAAGERDRSGDDGLVGSGVRLAGGGHPLGAISVEALPDAAGATPGLGYRTRMRFAINDAGLVGLKAARSHKIIPAADCLLPVPEISDAVPESVTNFGHERALVAVASAEVASDVVAGGGFGVGSDVGAATDLGADDELHPEVYEPDAGGGVVRTASVRDASRAGDVGNFGGGGSDVGTGTDVGSDDELHPEVYEPDAGGNVGEGGGGSTGGVGGSGGEAGIGGVGSGSSAGRAATTARGLAAPDGAEPGRFAAPDESARAGLASSDDSVPTSIAEPGRSTSDRLDLPDGTAPARVESEFDGATPARPEAEFDEATPARLEAEFGGHDTHRPVAAEVRGREFEVDLNGFWQVHRAAPETLVNAVLEFAQVRPGETVFDLYGGVGLFAAFLADATGPEGAVHLIEGDAAAVEYAKQNLDDLPWVTMTCADVRELAELVDLAQSGPTARVAGTNGGSQTGLADRDAGTDSGVNESGLADSNGAMGLAGHPLHFVHPSAPSHLTEQVLSADLVVVDPPRAGLGADVVEAILALQPSRIVYVSCDSATFARDVKTFAEHGYDLDQLRAFDLFPMTKHLETVALLVPQAG